jgi:toxin ParE1/3/4
MSEPIILKTPLARTDLASCRAYIGERNLDAAHRFRLAAEATFAALASMPNAGAPYEVTNPRLQGLRCARVRRLRNDLISYRPIDGGIDVIRVLHAARDIVAILDEPG